MARSTPAPVRLLVAVVAALVLGTTAAVVVGSSLGGAPGTATRSGNGDGGGGSAPHYAVVGSIQSIEIHNVTVGLWPSHVIYDAQSRILYVTSEFSQTVSLVDPSPFRVSRVIATGADARGLALDAATHRLFVSNDYADSLTVINTTTNTILTTLDYPSYGSMVGVQLDPATGELLVLANSPPTSILSINPNTYNVTRILPIDANPGGGEGYAINSTTHVLYFPARGDLAVSEIGELNGTTFSRVPMPGIEGPMSTFLDPLNGLLYVMLGGWLWTNPGTIGVVLNPATDRIVSTLPLGTRPDAYAYDPGSELLFVACAASGNISIINASTNQIVGSITLGNGTLPQSVAVDPATGSLYVGESGTGELVEVAPSSEPPPLTTPGPYLASITVAVAARWTGLSSPIA